MSPDIHLKHVKPEKWVKMTVLRRVSMQLDDIVLAYE